MTAFGIILLGTVIGWIAYEYLTPWGTVAKLKEMEENDE